MIYFRIEKWFLLISIIHLVLFTSEIKATVFNLIKELLSNNVAGEPIVHKTTTWDFDPEVNEKRRPSFYEQNGYRAAKFIEKIGLGIDGKEEERRIMQSIRDQGRLNGEHVINFP